MAKIALVHPLRHDWVLVGDVVTDDRRGVIWEFERQERCDYCDLRRLRVFQVRPMWIAGPLRYKGKFVPLEERVSTEQTQKLAILATTKNAEIREAIK